jgi:hypothetical protein
MKKRIGLILVLVFSTLAMSGCTSVGKNLSNAHDFVAPGDDISRVSKSLGTSHIERVPDPDGKGHTFCYIQVDVVLGGIREFYVHTDENGVVDKISAPAKMKTSCMGIDVLGIAVTAKDWIVEKYNQYFGDDKAAIE